VRNDEVRKLIDTMRKVLCKANLEDNYG
jgi:hypothetical protein